MNRIPLKRTAKSQRDLSKGIFKLVGANQAIKKAFPLPVDPRVTLEGNISFYFEVPAEKIDGLTLDSKLRTRLESVAQKGGVLGDYLEAEGTSLILLQSRSVPLSGGKTGWVLTYSPRESS